MEVKTGNGNIIRHEANQDEFNSIEVSGMFKIILVQGDSSKTIIEADQNLLDYIEIKVKNKKLQIESKANLKPSAAIQITVMFKKLNRIMLSGNVNLISENKLNLDVLELDVSGSASLKLDLNCFEFIAAMSGNSTTEFAGFCSHSKIETSGNTEILNQDFVTEKMEINSSGNSKIVVNVLNTLDVTASGNSEIEYFGTPEVKSSKSGQATVSKIF